MSDKMTNIIQQEITNCISFPQYLSLSKEATDKVGVLVLCFRRLHPHAPIEDFKNLGGRVAGLWVKSHKDTGYLLKIIWDTSSANISGSHLNYIQGILTKCSVSRVPPLTGHAGMEVIK